jgi:hypothetical protein
MRRQDKLKVIMEANQRLEEKFLNEKAIGFKTAGDNRDKDTGSEKTKLGFNPSKDLEDKIISLMIKLKAMSEKGESGEKDTAMRKLNDLAKKYGINTSNLGAKSSKLGFKFSWENGDYDIKDITKEVNKLN